MKIITKVYTYCLLVCCALVWSCADSKHAGSEIDGEPAVELHYATLLSLTEGNGFIAATITNPWDSTAVLHRYVLVLADKPLPEELPEGDVVRIPLKKAVITSSVHCSLIDQMGAYGSIGGVTDSQFIVMDKLQKDLKAGRISDLGEQEALNIERLIDLNPDAIFVSPYEGNPIYDRVAKLKIPVIECTDYMENVPLGRAEWMRFYGLLFGKSETTDSIFNEIADRYNSLKAKTKDIKQRPTVLCDTKYGSVWNVSGGLSTTGHLLKDAGADYVFANEQTAASLPLSPEVVFDRGQNADFWIIKYNQAANKTYAELAADYANYAHIKAFKTRNIYACNTSACTFYEDTPFRPDILLAEYIKIFHPSVLKDYELKYFSPL